MKYLALFSAFAALVVCAPAPSSSKQLVRRDPPLSDGVSVLDTINQFRSAYSLPTLSWNDQLEANAAKTGADDGGVNEIHELNPPSMAQVIAPGPVNDISGVSFPVDGLTPFGITYVAGWLCEVPTDPEISDLCGPANNVMHFVYSDTGHHDILTSTQYTNIGCAFTANPDAATDSTYQGLWICDLN